MYSNSRFLDVIELVKDSLQVCNCRKIGIMLHVGSIYAVSL